MDLQTTTKLTYDDYVLIPDDGLRHEIIDGEHHVNPAPNVRHQRVSRRLFLALANFIERHDLGEIFYSPIDVVFSDHNVVQPDILFIRKANTGELYGAFVKITPDLVVEILSIGNRRHDEVRKRELYDRFNVPEYWIVDPELDSVKIYRRAGETFGAAETVSMETSGEITTPLLPGFALPIDNVFAE
jgi:Uma2 family endonuclease